MTAARGRTDDRQAGRCTRYREGAPYDVRNKLLYSRSRQEWLLDCDRKRDDLTWIGLRLNNHSNLCGLVGAFISAPLGFLVGAAYGVARAIGD
jgi:hypothetical protein